MFIVIELQTNANGTVSSILTAHDTLDEARNKYFTVLAAAAVSQLPCHAAVLLGANGVPIEYRHFEHVPAGE